MTTELPRILCVDDEAHVLSALKRQMRTKYNIVTATSGQDGLEEIKNNGPFDVVISDFRMPGMDGSTFLSKVKDIDPATTRILLTGEANVKSVQSAINDGHVYKVLLKPCSHEELIEAMASALKQHDNVQSANQQVDELLKSLAP